MVKYLYLLILVLMSSIVYANDTITETNLCPTTFAGQLLLFIFVVVPICFIFVAFAQRLRGLGVINALWLFVVGWFIAGCSALLGGVVMGLGLIIVIASALM